MGNDLRLVPPEDAIESTQNKHGGLGDGSRVWLKRLFGELVAGIR